ncbi:hypothetical protein psal_cds_289 [Pandoravirus salinus]|uniref:Cyclic nucleotide-binding domain-containing protein n=1 Tax=Pandoravirus salinus TaxID=1349410 RepID=S4VWQ9_9VIRU|nr:hypothetical protein psal_cds_289 [Pandoravirus salinus]AGO83881.1 hypothetical protein psal_cds_289 [Pandoravirus salinus]
MAHTNDSRKRTADSAFAHDSAAPLSADKRARTAAAEPKHEPATGPSPLPPTRDGRRWFADGRRLGPPATYNKYLSVMAAVKALGMKEKRELFKLMREGVVGKRGRVTEHTFIPRLGVTMGEFALFYVLIDNPRAPS